MKERRESHCQQQKQQLPATFEVEYSAAPLLHRHTRVDTANEWIINLMTALTVLALSRLSDDWIFKCWRRKTNTRISFKRVLEIANILFFSHVEENIFFGGASFRLRPASITPAPAASLAATSVFLLMCLRSLRYLLRDSCWSTASMPDPLLPEGAFIYYNDISPLNYLAPFPESDSVLFFIFMAALHCCSSGDCSLGCVCGLLWLLSRNTCRAVNRFNLNYWHQNSTLKHSCSVRDGCSVQF